MAQKPPEAPKRDLSVDLESAHRLRAFLAPFETLPGVIEAAVEAEQRTAAATAALRGLENQKAVLEQEVKGLGDKAAEARTAADRLIAQAAEAQRRAQEKAAQAERDTALVIQQATTRQRQETKALEDAHAARVLERTQEIAHLDGRVTALKTEIDALLKRLGG